MFQIKCVDGRVFRGDKTPWHDIPADVVIKELSVELSRKDGKKTVTCANHKFSKFEQYGFQMFDLQAVDGERAGTLLEKGVQVLGVSAGIVHRVEIQFGTGRTEIDSFPLEQMTYNRALLRNGAKS